MGKSRVALFIAVSALVTSQAMLRAAEINGRVVDDGVTINLVEGAAFWFPEHGLLRTFLCSESFPNSIFEQWEAVVPMMIEADSLRNGKGLVTIDLYFNDKIKPTESEIKKSAHRMEIINPTLKSYSTISDSDQQMVTNSIRFLEFTESAEGQRVEFHLNGEESKTRVKRNMEKTLTSWDLQVDLPIYKTRADIKIEKRR